MKKTANAAEGSALPLIVITHVEICFKSDRPSQIPCYRSNAESFRVHWEHAPLSVGWQEHKLRRSSGTAKIPSPGKDEILVKVTAIGLNPIDCTSRYDPSYNRKIVNYGILRAPTVLGVDTTGLVERVGEGITRFKPGDIVYQPSGFLISMDHSALQQYVFVFCGRELYR